MILLDYIKFSLLNKFFLQSITTKFFIFKDFEDLTPETKYLLIYAIPVVFILLLGSPILFFILVIIIAMLYQINYEKLFKVIRILDYYQTKESKLADNEKKRMLIEAIFLHAYNYDRISLNSITISKMMLFCNKSQYARLSNILELYSKYIKKHNKHMSNKHYKIYPFRARWVISIEKQVIIKHILSEIKLELVNENE